MTASTLAAPSLAVQAGPVMYELFERYPQMTGCPHHPLGDFPTPVRSAPELARYLDVDEVHVKCDDQSSALYGGNKVRKLEFLLADALEKGCSRVWTVGAIGSHHVLATALYARQLGLQTEVCHFGQPVNDHVRQTCLAVAATGAHLTLCQRWQLPILVAYHRMARGRIRLKRESYYIPGGGSSVLGCMGYVNAALELAAQVAGGQLPRPDVLFVPVGTAGTLVGLLLGFQLAELDVELVGVRVVDRILANRITVRRLAAKAIRWLERRGVCPREGFDRGAFELDHSQIGEGYGVPTEASLQAVELARSLAGLELETTYTAKSMAALLDLRVRGKSRWRRILFWNTYNSCPLDPLIPDGFDHQRLPVVYHPFFGGTVGP
ncbi:MAG: pyridoxal-phosphate dependent enzyme [Bradymonadales bacterium]|nr:pyridoxal-phosphate dependent enzyme [Bradymonadales bacterium]